MRARNDHYGLLAGKIPRRPFLLNGAEGFVYRGTSRGGHRFMLVDVATGVKRPAFDQALLAAVLNGSSHNSCNADHLRLEGGR